jgi:hypothetical protein
MMKFSSDSCAAIKDRQALADYVSSLAVDLRENPARWENNTLPEFLSSMAAWIEDMDGYYTNQGLKVPESPSWSTLAEILTAARVYE